MDNANDDSVSTGAYVAASALGAATGAGGAISGVQAYYAKPERIIRDTVGKFANKGTNRAEMEKTLNSLIGRIKTHFPTVEHFDAFLEEAAQRGIPIGEGLSYHLKDIYREGAVPQMAENIGEMIKDMQKDKTIGKFLKPTFIGSIPGGAKTIAVTGALAGMGAAIYVLRSIESAIKSKQTFVEKVAEKPIPNGQSL